MKKIIVAILVVSYIIVSCEKSAVSKVKDENVISAKQRDVNSQNLAVVSFDKETYDFGTIDAGEVVETTFMITNTGKSDLLITNAKSTCGCTVPTWPKKAIQPGDSATMKVKFDSKGKRNNVSKTITLTTNTLNGKETVKIKGFVAQKEK